MEDLVYVTGIHGVRGVLEKSLDRVVHVLVEKGRLNPRAEELVQEAKEQGLRVLPRESRFFREIGGGRNAQGIAVALEEFPYTDIEDVEWGDGPALVLVCDGVTDPQNLGAIIRTAAFLEVAAVVIPKDRSASVTPVTERVAAGGCAHVPIVRVTNIARALSFFKERGFWVYGTVETGGQSPRSVDLTGRTCIVVGAEGEGIRRLTREHCDVLLTLPASGPIPALNVSVFTGLILYEARRQESAE